MYQINDWVVYKNKPYLIEKFLDKNTVRLHGHDNRDIRHVPLYQLEQRALVPVYKSGQECLFLSQTSKLPNESYVTVEEVRDDVYHKYLVCDEQGNHEVATPFQLRLIY
jgi:hypothetical protein